MINNVTLLFGMPRSGTTWIGKVFDSHPDSAYLHEPDSHQRINTIPLFLTQDLFQNYELQAKEFVAGFSEIRNVNVMAKQPLFDKQYLSELQKYLFRSGLYLSKFARLDSVLYQPSYHNPEKVNYIWKSIESLGRLYLFLETLQNCKGIHIIRHPCGQIASVIKGESINKFSGNYQSSEDYDLFSILMDTEIADKYKLSLEDMKKISPIERLAWKWVIYNEKAFNDCENHSSYRLAVYEKLCAHPMDEYKGLFHHAGLSWNQQTENFLMKSTLKSSHSYYSVYKNPLESANKWRKMLASPDIQKIMHIVEQSPLIEYID